MTITEPKKIIYHIRVEIAKHIRKTYYLQYADMFLSLMDKTRRPLSIQQYIYFKTL